jgi:hypothetical protein
MTLRVPRIPFRLEDRLARSVSAIHQDLFDGLVKFAARVAEKYGYHFEGGALVADAEPHALMNALVDLMGETGPDVEKLRARLNAQLVGAERAFFTRFMGKGDSRTVNVLTSMSIDKDAAFAGKIQGLRELYLDEALERILGEQDDLRASFLMRLVDWAEGRAEKLEVADLVKGMKEQADGRAKFFARDQFSRFERSLTLASFEAAQAPYVEVFNSNDIRVRESHRNGTNGWGRKLFTRAGLLQDSRWGDYNCRCGFVPRWELTDEMRGRFVA